MLPIFHGGSTTMVEYLLKSATAYNNVLPKQAEMLESQSEFNRRITKLQDSIEKLTKTQEQKTAAEYFYIQAQEKKVWEEVREQVVKLTWRKIQKKL